jgi:putative FmdB family regulatory protein
MPIYEYECVKCGECFELRRSMSDSDQNVKCPKCGTESPRRVFSAFATTSDGSGAPSSPT